MTKISLQKVVAIADALNRRIPGESLSGNRHRHKYAELTLTLVNDFDFEALTIDRDAGGLWYLYKDMEVFKVRRGEPVPATEEEVAKLERLLDWHTETLNGLV